MKLFTRTVVLTFMGMAAIGAVRAARAETGTSATAAKDFVAKVTGEGIAVLRDKSLTKEQKTEKIQKIAFDNMDFDTISRLSLGRHWRELSDEKKKEFMAEFKKRVVASYSHTTDEYTDEDVNVASSRQESDGDWTVETQVKGTDNNGVKKDIAKVLYRLRSKDGQLKVIDVTIDGISLIGNFRSQFQEVMANGGIEKLLKLLREKNATGEK